jgi:hypothetical protein
MLATMGGHLLYIYVTRKWVFFSPLNAFYVGIGIYFCLSLLNQTPQLVSLYGAWVVNTVGALAEFSILCVIIGYESMASRRVGHELGVLPAFNPEKILHAGFAWVIVGHLCQAYMIWRTGGVGAYFAHFKPDSQASGSDSVMVALTASLVYITTFGAFLLLLSLQKQRQRPTTTLLIIAYVVLHGLYLVYTGSRSRTIDYVAAVLIGIYFPRGRNPSARLLFLCALLLVIVVPVQRAYRERFRSFRFNLGDVPEQEMARNILMSYWVPEDAAASGSEAAVACAVVRYVPDVIPYDHGRMILALGTRSIPRALWPGKIYPDGEAWDKIFRRLAGRSHINKAGFASGPASTFVGYWYYIGGWIGIIIGGVLTGWFFRAIEIYTDRQRDNPFAALLARIFCYAGFTHATAPFDFFHVLAPMIPIFLVTAWLCREKRGSP